LAHAFAGPFLEALALEGVIESPARVNPATLARSIKRAAEWFGPMRPGDMWFEQYGQWKRLRGEQNPQEHAVQGQYARLRDLQHETAWLDEQRKDWQQLAMQQEGTLRAQGAWNEECEERMAEALAAPCD